MATQMTPFRFYRVASSAAGAIIGAHHGYHRRGRSIAGAMLWGIGGLIAPTITLGIILAQKAARK